MHSSELRSFSRREFVRSLGAAGAALAAAPLLKARTESGAHAERSLVVVHLAGGHDGLSTFVPSDDDAYQRARPTLALRPKDLLRLGETVGLNRAASELAPLYDDGELAVLPQVGFSPASASHYRATQVWESGSAGDEIALSRWSERGGHAVVDHGAEFDSALEQIAARLRARGDGAIHHLRLEGFDTHFDQRAAHAAAIATFARGMARFRRLLARSGAADRVLVLAFSEFGRALEENEFGGTHHGAVGQCYLLGPSVRGGIHSRIDPQATTAEISHQQVIATVAGWLGAEPISGKGRCAALPRLLV